MRGGLRSAVAAGTAGVREAVRDEEWAPADLAAPIGRPPRRRMAHRLRNDEGNVSVLTLGFLVLAVLLILVVSMATHVHLQRVRLVALADELAVDAADALDLGAYYAGSVPEPTVDRAVLLSQTRMEAAVFAHLDARGGPHLNDVTVERIYSPDGATAVVEVSVVVHPLWLIEPLIPFHDGIELRATSSARAF